MRHEAMPTKEPSILIHSVTKVDAGQPGKMETGKAILTGWCMDISQGDEINFGLNPLFTIASIKKRDHKGIFDPNWSQETIKEKTEGQKDAMKTFWAYKANEKNKDSFFEAECTFTPPVK